MFERTIIGMLVVLCNVVVDDVQATEIKKQWEIYFGQSANEIQLIDDLVLYDFEVFDGRLFLCDIAQNKIKLFDNTGKAIENINLPAAPEIIKLWDSMLVVLIQNGKLGIYDIKKKKLSFIDLGINIQSFQYSAAFFSDSLLFIPKTNQFISIKSDAYKIDISKLPIFQVSIVKDAYDIEKKMSFPNDTILFSKNYYIQQMDFCYCSSGISIIRKSDKYHPGSKDREYLFFEKETNRFINLGRILEDKDIMILHTNTCRGFKVYKDSIYFSGTRFENYKEKSLTIWQMPVPK
jgi:hypothetical protein